MGSKSPIMMSSQSVVAPMSASQLSMTNQPLIKSKAYRPVRPLPYELRDHCNVYIEEELFSQALSLLSSVLIAGTDGTGNGNLLPTYIPPPQILALAATLVVHPSMTSRASSPDKVQVANEALFLLQHVNNLVGPTNAHFGTAFQFSSYGIGRREGRRGTGRHTDRAGSSDEDEKFQTELANKSAIWNRAEDFWSVLGWAFNCSSQYPKRWDRWKPWLKFMLDVLESDLEEKIAASDTANAKGDESGSDSLLEESLLAHYLTSVPGGRASKRKVMRAILADGSKKSLGEFVEIWKNETKPPKQQKEEGPIERKKLNFEEGEYADYMDLDEDEDDDQSTSRAQSKTPVRTPGRRRRTLKSNTPGSDEESTPVEEGSSEDFGGSDSMSLRKRVIALLIRISAVYEKAFMEIEDTIDLLTEFIRPLPLSIFTQFVLPSTPYLEPHAQASLNQNLLRPIISSDAPIYKAETMTQKEFETHFLPYAANYTNYVENARVSMLVESLLRLMFRYGTLQITDSLTAGLKKGIKARESKAKFGAKKKVGSREAEEDKATKMLELSAMRMRALLKVAACPEDA